jgi:hypothetical protein
MSGLSRQVRGGLTTRGQADLPHARDLRRPLGLRLAEAVGQVVDRSDRRRYKGQDAANVGSDAVRSFCDCMRIEILNRSLTGGYCAV